MRRPAGLAPAPSTRASGAPGVAVDVIDLGRRRDRRRFLDVSASIYRDDPHYIEPLRIERMRFLDPNRSPALRELEIHALLARRGKTVLGRITAHIDRAYDRYHQTRAGWFGFFECVDDRAVAHALLDAAVSWLSRKGVQQVIGPMNFTTNQECGLLVENFGRPAMIGTTYNLPYYERLVTSYGFSKVKELYSWWIDVPQALAKAEVARVVRLADRIAERSRVVIRQASKRRYHDEWKILCDLYNRCWKDNWGFVPISEAEFQQAADSALPFLREQVILFAEAGGCPVGFALTLPDINEITPRNGRLLPFGWARLLFGRRKIRHGRTVLLGVLPEYRKRGLESLLFVETAIRGNAIGLTSGETSWTLEDNVLINRGIEAMGARLDRRYRLFGLALPPADA